MPKETESQTEEPKTPKPEVDDYDGITVESFGTNSVAAADEDDSTEDMDDKAGAKADADADGDADENTDDKTADADADKKEKWGDLPKGVRKRVARANRKAREAEDRAEAAEAESAALKEAGKKPQSKPDAEPDTELDPDDFESFDKYLDAVDKAKHAETKFKEEAKEKPAADGLETRADGKKYLKGSSVEVGEFVTARADLAESIETDDPDLWESLSTMKELNISPELVMALNETSDPAAVARLMVDDKELATKLSGMSEFQQARELAKLDGTVSDKPKSRLAGRKGTNAPPPIDAGKSRGGAAVDDPSNMTQAEYEAWRTDQEKAVDGMWL